MRILIIDDNPHHAELASVRLEKEGWKVQTTDHVEPSLGLNDYDFILLDYSMPRSSGIELLKKMREIDVRTPVIFLTGHGNELIASEAIKLGAFDYVVKDTKLIYLDRLPSVIREAKSKHELIETNRFLIQELRKANDRLQKLTLTDEMTELYNYRFLKNQLDAEIKRAERYSKPLSICLIDLDHFKSINDQYGHPAGDAALKQVAKILLDSVRNVDFVGRYAGDEFLIIFPNTQLADAVKLCDRILKTTRETKLEVDGHPIPLSLSIGVTDYHLSRRNSVDSLMEAADRCLYLAKESGRNRVETGLRVVNSNDHSPHSEQRA